MNTKNELPADLDNYIAGLRIENINLKLAAKQADALLREYDQHGHSDGWWHRVTSFLASQQGEQCISDTGSCGIGGYCDERPSKNPEQADGAQGELHPDLKRVYDVIGLHYSHPVSILIANFENAKHFAELLHAVEREFFMVPGEPSDEPEDEGCEPDDVCLMSCWGSTQEQYIEQFRHALEVIQARAALAQPSPAPELRRTDLAAEDAVKSILFSGGLVDSSMISDICLAVRARASQELENQEPVARDPFKRQAFEIWAARKWGTKDLKYVRDDLPKDDPRYGEYCHVALRGAWEAWQARDAIAKDYPGEYGDAYQGAREDMLIWKRRALEAEQELREEKILTERLGNALNDENGPTFMGEPKVDHPSLEPVAYVLFRDGKVYYETDDNIVISNKPGDETDLYKWAPVYAAPVAQAGQVPEGYVLMPQELTAENGAKGIFIGEFRESIELPCPCVEQDEANEECELCHGDGSYLQPVSVGWDTIKAVYAMAVDKLAFEPKQGE